MDDLQQAVEGLSSYDGLPRLLIEEKRHAMEVLARGVRRRLSLNHSVLSVQKILLSKEQVRHYP